METNSPLLTDQYQLIMAYGYWKLGMADTEAVFHLSFRRPPFNAYAIAAGLNRVIEFLNHFYLSDFDLCYLKNLKNNHKPLFPEEFLSYLKEMKFNCDIDAVPEGNLVFAREPLLRIKGPILQCQLLETPLMNLINFATLIATKASRIYQAAGGDPVIEFGLRRAQGPDGGLTASRSAYIGGCVGTSNMLAGELYGIPIYGTQAHSWIMAFPTELEAFYAFAEVMQEKTVLLVDTYDSIQGILNAIEVGKALKRKGLDLVAIRLDSGDLLDLSRKARHLLNEANFKNTKIIASGDLNEKIIRELKLNSAPIDSWGVGTHLVTSYDEPALNAIYKLGGLRDTHGNWNYKMKLSDDPKKTSLPGILQTRRYYKNNIPIGDIIYDLELGEPQNFPADSDHQTDLIKPIFRKGKLVYSLPSIHSMRDICLEQINNYSQCVEPYPVTIEKKLRNLTQKLSKQLGSLNNIDKKSRS